MKKLKMKDVFTKEGYEGLTAAQRRFYLKVEQAAENSGLRRYPSTRSAVFANIPDEWWGKYTAEHIGEVAALLKKVYEDGRNYPNPDA